MPRRNTACGARTPLNSLKYVPQTKDTVKSLGENRVCTGRLSQMILRAVNRDDLRTSTFVAGDLRCGIAGNDGDYCTVFWRANFLTWQRTAVQLVRCGPDYRGRPRYEPLDDAV